MTSFSTKEKKICQAASRTALEPMPVLKQA
jgi:hypothetical protein